MRLQNGVYVLWDGREYLHVGKVGSHACRVLSADPEDLRRGFAPVRSCRSPYGKQYEGYLLNRHLESAHTKYWWARFQGRDYRVANYHEGKVFLDLACADYHLAHELGFEHFDRSFVKGVSVEELEAAWADCAPPPKGFPVAHSVRGALVRLLGRLPWYSGRRSLPAPDLWRFENGLLVLFQHGFYSARRCGADRYELLSPALQTPAQKGSLPRQVEQGQLTVIWDRQWHASYRGQVVRLTVEAPPVATVWLSGPAPGDDAQRIPFSELDAWWLEVTRLYSSGEHLPSAHAAAELI